MTAISLRGVGKKYRISSTQSLRLKDLFRFGERKERNRDFWALEDVSLEVRPGATLGILGRNGAGKSTLLQIISGVLEPTTGSVEVNGRLTAIFGLGSGFNPEFTGRDNVMLNGLILGIDRQEMLDRFDEIAAFADIGDFMDQPIKTYSSGMRSRLGFAVAVNVDPDILILDEALSAGDAAFKRKALRRMSDLRDSGTTVLFVSHSLGMIQRFCTEAVLLHKGHLIYSGGPEEVVDEYRGLLEGPKGRKGPAADRDSELDYAIDHEDEEDMPGSPNGSGGRRRATGEAEILSVELLGEDRERLDGLPSGGDLTVRVRARYAQSVEESALGVALRDGSGAVLFATSTDLEGAPLGSRAEGESVTVDFTFGVPLRPGGYAVDATVSGEDGRRLLAHSEATTFEVVSGAEERPTGGLIQLPATVEVYDREEQGPAA